MNNTMEYKGYLGSVEISKTKHLLQGKVMGIRRDITYSGETAEELIQNFHQSVDTYLTQCELTNQTPERAYKGQFNVRIPPYLHRLAAEYALNHQKTLNSFMEDAVREKLIREDLLS